ncbi:MAG: hypothetical protein M1813_001799 [Trichoglossum hirsutum]|jgi:lysophospholipase L1-like esterase|nr:MAG: hypothetical protein M1813_001799 [Trichoglossum hirsutum]
MVNNPRNIILGSAGLLLLLGSVSAVPAPGVGNLHPRAGPTAPKKYVAQGDSYAAGIAAGTAGTAAGDYDCSRFSGAYPVQLSQSFSTAPTFVHQACSGATAEDVRANQTMPADADLATLSVGGNNVGFGDIVNSCVYRFNPFGASCEDALTTSEGLINTALANAVSATINKILTDNTALILYVTGYVRFWNELTSQCDDVTWNYWIFQNNKMTKAIRARMNKGVQTANGIIKGEVDKIAAQMPGRVFFVDVDPDFEGHRFCEEGVTEPQKSGEDRSNTWLFQYNTPTGSVKDTDLLRADKTSQIYAAAFRQALASQGDGLLPPNGIYPALTLPADTTTLPVFIAKVFHPTTPGHQAMAKRVLAAINGS